MQRLRIPALILPALLLGAACTGSTLVDLKDPALVGLSVRLTDMRTIPVIAANQLSGDIPFAAPDGSACRLYKGNGHITLSSALQRISLMAPAGPDQHRLRLPILSQHVLEIMSENRDPVEFPIDLRVTSTSERQQDTTIVTTRYLTVVPTTPRANIVQLTRRSERDGFLLPIAFYAGAGLFGSGALGAGLAMDTDEAKALFGIALTLASASLIAAILTTAFSKRERVIWRAREIKN
jgi:hypothetical protein